MDNDPWNGKPVSEIYQLVFEKLKQRCEMEGVQFRQDRAIRTIATAHTSKVKDLIDENMTDYDERKLADIVERCIARYIEMEE